MLAFVAPALDAVVPSTDVDVLAVAPSIDVDVLAVVVAPALDVVPLIDDGGPVVAEIVSGIVADFVVVVLHPVFAFHVPL